MNSQAGRVVVGYDASAHSTAALEWAAAEAQRRGRPLTVLHVLDHVGPVPSPIGPFTWPEGRREEYQKIAAIGADRARSVTDRLDVIALCRVGRAATILTEVSQEADLLVIGTRGHGDLTGAVLGSVGFTVSAHASCPVVVVRGRTDRPGPDRPVVVGVDGSAESDYALRHAADVAAASQAPLLVVTAYRTLASRSRAEAEYIDLEAGGRPSFDTIAREAALQITTTAAQTAQQAYPQMLIREVIRDGSPATVLADVANGTGGAAGEPTAGLVVVGSRGRGSFTGLLLGSVGHELIHRGPCPVTIVPGLREKVSAPSRLGLLRIAPLT